jgi:hypothetical protein
LSNQAKQSKWQALPATEKQLNLLRRGNTLFKPDITRGAAAELVRELIESGELVEGYTLSDFEMYDPHAPRGNKTERRFCCFLCGDSKPKDREHRCLSVNTSTGEWKCHRCDAGGVLKEFRRDSPAIWTPTTRRAAAVKALAISFALPKPKTKPEPIAEETEKEGRWRGWWESATEIDGSPGADYLTGRSIPIETARAAGVRFSPEWYGRPAVLFPITDRTGALVAVSGRFVDGREDPKTMGAGPKSQGVFLAMPSALNARCAAICEGPFDALALAAGGVAAVAMIGVSGPEWLPRSLAFRSVLIATDNDKVGDEAAAKLEPAMKARGAHALRLRSQGVKDWADVLQRRGLVALRRHLRGFAVEPRLTIEDKPLPEIDPLTDDDVRICAARELAQAERLAEALFVARLLDAGEWRPAVERQLERLAANVYEAAA